MAWDLLVDRADLSHTELVDAPELDPADGQVVLKVDRVGMTANNVTYAVFGDAMQYWDFFPAEPTGRRGLRPGAAVGLRRRSRRARSPGWPRAPGSSGTCRRAATSSSQPAERRRQGVPRRERPPPAPADPLQRAHHHDRRPGLRPRPRGPAGPLPAAVHDELRAGRLPRGQRLLRRRHRGDQQRVEQDLLRHRLPARRRPPDRPDQRAATGRSPRASGATTRSSPTTRSTTCRRARAVFVDVAGDAAVRRQRARAPRTRALGGRRRLAPRRRARPRRPAATCPAVRRRSSSRPTRCASATPTGGPTAWRSATPRPGPGSRRWWPAGSTSSSAPVPRALRADWLEALAGATPPRTGHVIQL